MLHKISNSLESPQQTHEFVDFSTSSGSADLIGICWRTTASLKRELQLKTEKKSVCISLYERDSGERQGSELKERHVAVDLLLLAKKCFSRVEAGGVAARPCWRECDMLLTVPLAPAPLNTFTPFFFVCLFSC